MWLGWRCEVAAFALPQVHGQVGWCVVVWCWPEVLAGVKIFRGRRERMWDMGIGVWEFSLRVGRV